MPGMKMAMFEGDMEAMGASGALIMSEGSNPSIDGTTVYFYCEDVNNEIKRVEENGGKILIPKTSIEEYGFFAQFIDCEGNRVALHSME